MLKYFNRFEIRPGLRTKVNTLSSRNETISKSLLWSVCKSTRLGGSTEEDSTTPYFLKQEKEQELIGLHSEPIGPYKNDVWYDKGDWC